MCTEYWLTALSKVAQEKSVVRLSEHLHMTIAVDCDHKPHKSLCFLVCVCVLFVIVCTIFDPIRAHANWVLYGLLTLYEPVHEISNNVAF